MPAYSGKEVIRRLVHAFGFHVVSQRGSHVKLKKRMNGGTTVTVVPLHRELAEGTLRGVLRLAKISYEDFEDVTK